MITGRALLDGKPVPELAIAWINSASSMTGGLTPTIARQSSGRFKAHLTPGTWDLVIAGRGFARKILLNRQLPARQVTDLGDIALHHGFTVTGIVTDGNARPVADAEVTIRNSIRDTIDGSLTSIINGDFLARTDDTGRYRIEGVSQMSLSSSRARIRARNALVGASHSEWIVSGNATKDLVLQPAGSIEGTATPDLGSIVRIVPVAAPRSIMFESFTGGTFHFFDLPAGDYDLAMSMYTRKRVTVVANQTTTVAFP